MKQIKYSYCIDDNNELVHIKSLTNLTRHSRKLYCLQCGREMVANLGTKKTWHFSHKSECACDGESYLHKFVVAEPGDNGEHCDGAERQDNLPEYGRILTLVKELQAPLLPVI